MDWLTNQFQNRPKSNPLADKGQRTEDRGITGAWSQVWTMSVVKGKVSAINSRFTCQLDTPDQKQGRGGECGSSTCKGQLWGGSRWCGAWLVMTYCLHGGYDISNDCCVCVGQQNRCTQGNKASKWRLPHCAAHCVALQSERRLCQRLHVIMTLAGGMQQTEKYSPHTQTDSCHMPHASTQCALQWLKLAQRSRRTY